jgi:hypothetical protein
VSDVTTVTNNVAYSPGQMGFKLAVGNMICSNNYVYNAGDHGFYSNNPRDLIISNNYAESCAQDGFNFSNAEYLHCCTFTGNIATLNDGDGFELAGWHSTINSNMAYWNNGFGFNWASGYPVNCAIVGNTMFKNNSGGWNTPPSSNDNQVGYNANY